MTTETYDAIIIGSGAGGASVAYNMVQAGKRVLVLEKGRLFTAQLQHAGCQNGL